MDSANYFARSKSSYIGYIEPQFSKNLFTMLTLQRGSLVTSRP